jgi:hypothetical protein
VTPKGNAKLLDFGFARWRKGAASASGQVADERADVVALGQLLFEMLTGNRPSGDSTEGLSQSLPRELDAIVSKTLAADAGSYPAAATLAAELRSVAAILDVRASAEAVRVVPTRSRRPHRWREPWIIIAVALVFAALVGAVWWLF